MLTRPTIWLALVAYTIGEIGRTGRWSGLSKARSRVVWSAGCLLYVAHVLSAFGEHYRWSHTAAYDDVARQTATQFGIDWGGGLYVNYGFTLLWIGEAVWWWLAPAHHARRAPLIDRVVRATFLFMIVNGAVVFVDGPMRWLGALLVGILLATWWARDASEGRRPQDVRHPNRL